MQYYRQYASLLDTIVEKQTTIKLENRKTWNTGLDLHNKFKLATSYKNFTKWTPSCNLPLSVDFPKRKCHIIQRRLRLRANDSPIQSALEAKNAPHQISAAWHSTRIGKTHLSDDRRFHHRQKTKTAWRYFAAMELELCTFYFFRDLALAGKSTACAIKYFWPLSTKIPTPF